MVNKLGSILSSIQPNPSINGRKDKPTQRSPSTISSSSQPLMFIQRYSAYYLKPTDECSNSHPYVSVTQNVTL